MCLVGLLGLGASRDPFREQIKTYFAHWIEVLAACLHKARVPQPEAGTLAEEAVAGIQGAIVLSRALDDKSTFTRIVRSHEARLLDAVTASGKG